MAQHRLNAMHSAVMSPEGPAAQPILPAHACHGGWPETWSVAAFVRQTQQQTHHPCKQIPLATDVTAKHKH